MKKKLVALITGLMIATTCIPASSFAADNHAFKAAKPFSSEKEYCKAYGIPYVNTAEFKDEVRHMMKERRIGSNGRIVTKRNSIMKKRNVPNAYVSDVLWTDNPITPWNHVGIYTKTNQITEALAKGVCQRNTGMQNEYALKVYKVVTKNNGSNRYSSENRTKVSNYAVAQVGKGYDVNFADNKQNTKKSNKKYNCSELVWKAWRYNNGSVNVDLDSNGGKGVYPDNIANSKRTIKVSEVK